MPTYSDAPKFTSKDAGSTAEARVASAFSAYKRHTGGVYKTATLAKFQRMRDAFRAAERVAKSKAGTRSEANSLMKTGTKLAKQVEGEIIDQGEKQMAYAAKGAPKELEGKDWDTGPRGGKFYTSASGAKVYVK